jgi:tetratricopeptide (TPR) repeat protein
VIILKRNVFLVLFFFIIVFGNKLAQAQTNYTDNCLNYLQAQNFKNAIKAGTEAVIWDPNNMYSYTCLGKAYLDTSIFDLALKNFQIAYNHSNSITDLALISNMLGLAYQGKDDLANAEHYYSKSLRLYKLLKNKIGEAAQLNNLGEIYNLKGDSTKALEYFEKALALNESIKNNQENIAVNYNNIAVVYAEKKDFQKAIECLQKSLNINESDGNFLGSAQAMLNLGNIYRQTKNYNDSEKYLESGKIRIEKTGNKFWLARSYEYFGLFYLDKNDSKKAINSFSKAIDIYKQVGDKTDSKKVSKLLSQIYKNENSDNLMDTIKLNLSEFYKNLINCFQQ